jgi:hypothetical protein
VKTGSAVTLDGTASRDPEGGPLAYEWSQLWGEPVDLAGADTAMPGFTAPDGPDETVLVFGLLVRDGALLESADRVEVWVGPNEPAPPAASGVNAEVLSHTSARVSWATDIDAKGAVLYGTTAALGLESDPEPGFSTAHEVTLDALISGATYQFAVRSEGANGAWTLSDLSTFTLSPPPASEDSDLDGMPDAWEDAHGLDKADPSDAGADPDSDGLTNLEEYLHGTDPGKGDTDSDGASDGWEVASGTDPARSDSVPPPQPGPVYAPTESCGAAGEAAFGAHALLLIAAWPLGAALTRRRRRCRPSRG